MGLICGRNQILQLQQQYREKTLDLNGLKSDKLNAIFTPQLPKGMLIEFGKQQTLITIETEPYLAYFTELLPARRKNIKGVNIMLGCSSISIIHKFRYNVMQNLLVYDNTEVRIDNDTRIFNEILQKIDFQVYLKHSSDEQLHQDILNQLQTECQVIKNEYEVEYKDRFIQL